MTDAKTPVEFDNLPLETAKAILARHRSPERIAPAFAELIAVLAPKVAAYQHGSRIMKYQRIRELGEALNSLAATDDDGYRIMSAAHFTLKEHYKIYADFLNGEWSGIGVWLA